MKKIINTFESIQISKIIYQDRLRKVSDAHVEALMISIEEHGLQTPLLINQVDDKYYLIAGAHRYAALIKLNVKEALCRVYKDVSNLQAKLIEIDENLVRHELNPLDRAIFLSTRKNLYEELYPETKAGVAGGKATLKSTNVTFSFVDSTADKLGLGKRTIERAVRIATCISLDIRERLDEAGINKEGELYTLTKFTAEEQEKIIAHLISKKAKNLSVAINIIQGKIDFKESPEEIAYSKLLTLYLRSDKKTQKAFCEYLENAK